MTYLHIHVKCLYVNPPPTRYPFKRISHGSTKIYQKISLAHGVPLNNLKPKDVELIKHHAAFRQISYSIYIPVMPSPTCRQCVPHHCYLQHKGKKQDLFSGVQTHIQASKKDRSKRDQAFMPLDPRQHRQRRGRQTESSGLGHHRSPLNTETCCSPK